MCIQLTCMTLARHDCIMEPPLPSHSTHNSSSGMSGGRSPPVKTILPKIGRYASRSSSYVVNNLRQAMCLFEASGSIDCSTSYDYIDLSSLRCKKAFQKPPASSDVTTVGLGRCCICVGYVTFQASSAIDDIVTPSGQILLPPQN
jgi:hypothetical protein